MSNPDTPQPPEGATLEAARRRLGISQNEAARRAGISGTRWRQIVKGRQTGAQAGPVTGSATTVARMASAVGLSAEDLEEVGRADAAEVLRRMDEGRSMISVLEREVATLLERVPPRRRRHLEELIRAEDEDLVRLRVQQLTRWRKLLESD